MDDVRVAQGTIVVYSDVACRWSTIAVHRLLQARRRLGLDEEVHLEHRLFSLEDAYRAPLSRRTYDVELAAAAAVVPELHWHAWSGDPEAFPVTSLLANEAVCAVRHQGSDAAEELDMALRQAFFRDGACISLRHVVLDVAEGCLRVDAGMLEKALDEGSARGEMMAEYHRSRLRVRRSPHLFVADGYEVVSPGLDVSWVDGPDGYPVVEAEYPGVFDGLVRRAAARPG